MRASVVVSFALVFLSFDDANMTSRAFSVINTLQVQPPRPNDCTYWVTESLLAGEYPTDEYSDDSSTRLRQYLERGITYFVDLTQTGECQPYDNVLQQEARNMNLPQEVVYKQCSIEDFGIPSENQMKEILDIIDEAIEQNHKVYVHCRGGIGRTGTTVGCYLARYGYRGNEALQEVNRLSSMSPETDMQVNLVRNWNESS